MDWDKFLAVFGGIAGIATILGVIVNIAQILEYIKKAFRFLIGLFCRSKSNREKTEGKDVGHKIPNNLPASTALIGRDEIMNKIASSIENNTLTMLIGKGGIGKSSLVLETVKKFYLYPEKTKTKSKRNFKCDAIVWISSKDEPVTFESFLNTVARALDYTGILQINDINKKADEVDQLNQKYNILFIVDNFETIDDPNILKFLENVSDNDRIIVTSRVRHDWNVRYSPIYVQPLNEIDGKQLIEYECRQRGLNYTIAEDGDLFEALYNITGGIPLGIKWAIGQADVMALPLSTVINFLQRGEANIFEKMFYSGWSQLDDDCKRLAYYLLFFSAPTTRGVLRQLNCVPNNKYDIALGRLISLSFVEVNGKPLSDDQTLGFHPMTRSFLQRQYDEAPDVHVEIYSKLLSHYASFCKLQASIATVESYNNLELELNNILKIFFWGCSGDDSDRRKLAISIANDISVFLWSRGYWSSRIETSKYASELCVKENDYKNALLHSYYRGIVSFWQGDLKSANENLSECKDYLKNCNDDKCSQALVMRLEALIGMYRPEWKESIAIFEKVLAILESDSISQSEIALFADWRVTTAQGYNAGKVAIMQECGITYNRHQCYKEALVWLEKSLQLANQIEDIEGQAVTYSHMGASYIGLGWHKECENACTVGLELASSVRRKSTMGRCHQRLCEAEYLQCGKIRKTKEHAEGAILWFDKLGMQEESKAVKRMLEK